MYTAPGRCSTIRMHKKCSDRKSVAERFSPRSLQNRTDLRVHSVTARNATLYIQESHSKSFQTPFAGPVLDVYTVYHRLRKLPLRTDQRRVKHYKRLKTHARSAPPPFTEWGSSSRVIRYATIFLFFIKTIRFMLIIQSYVYK